MWNAIVDKFQCCYNPQKNDTDKPNANKEVDLDNLTEKVSINGLKF